MRQVAGRQRVSRAMLAEEGASAKTREQDRLKALDASIVNLERA